MSDSSPCRSFSATERRLRCALAGGSTSITSKPSVTEMPRSRRSSFPIPANESQRVTALRALDILDSPPETAYDEIAVLAAQICECPIGYISFVDDDRSWLKAKYGLPPHRTDARRAAAVCSTTICGVEMFVVPDMTQDSRFDRIAVVVDEPHCRFYCGVPLAAAQAMRWGRCASWILSRVSSPLNRRRRFAGCRVRFLLCWSCVEGGSGITKRLSNSSCRVRTSLDKKRVLRSFLTIFCRARSPRN